MKQRTKLQSKLLLWLALCLLAIASCISVLVAFAEDSDPAVSGTDYEYDAQTSVYKAMTFKGLKYVLTDSTEITDASRNVEITADISVTEGLTLAGNVNYTLYTEKAGGVTLTRGEEQTGTFLTLGAGTSLTIGREQDEQAITYDGADIRGTSSAFISSPKTAGTVTINNAVIKNCDAGANGSVMSFTQSNLIVRNIVLQNNKKSNTEEDTTKNGVIYSTGKVEIYGGVYENNRHEGSSAAVLYVSGSKGKLYLYGGTFRNNVALKDGGVIKSGNSSAVYIYGGSFENNRADNGGAIYSSSTTLEIDGTPRNSEGAEVAQDAADRVNAPLVFSGNTATSAGGTLYLGIGNANATATLKNFTITSEDTSVYISDSAKYSMSLTATDVTVSEAEKRIVNPSSTVAFTPGVSFAPLRFANDETEIAIDLSTTKQMSEWVIQNDSGSLFTGTTPYADKTTWFTYTVEYPADVQKALMNATVNGGNISVSYRVNNASEWTPLSFTHNTNQDVEFAGLVEGRKNVVEVKFAAQDTAQGGGANPQAITFKYRLDTTLTFGNNSLINVNLWNDIFDSEGQIDNINGFPLVNVNDRFLYYQVRYPADANDPHMTVQVDGDARLVQYQVNDGEWVTAQTEKDIATNVFFSGFAVGQENLVKVRFSSSEVGNGAHIKSLAFKKMGPTLSFAEGEDTVSVMEPANQQDKFYDATSGLGTSGTMVFADAGNYFIYRVTFPAGTRAAKAIVVVDIGAQESVPKLEYRNISSDTFITATLVKNPAIEQTLLLSALLNADADTTLEFKFSDPTPEDGNGTQLFRIVFIRSMQSDTAISFAAGEETKNVNVNEDIFEQFALGSTDDHTPVADATSYFTYKIEFPENAVNPYMQFIANGSNMKVSYSLNGADYVAIEADNGSVTLFRFENFTTGKNTVLVRFSAEDTTQGNGANLKSMMFGFTAAEKIIDGISLDKTTATVQAGGSLKLVASTTGGEEHDKTVTWKSSDPSVAKVTDGVVTAIKAGSVTITVTAADGQTASCEVTVTAVQDEEPEPEPEPDSTGCGGSLLATVPIALAVSCLMVAALAAVKKKDN